MASNAFLKLTGQTQGAIKGSVTQKGHEGEIQVTSWSWGGERDAGVASASEFHITKRRDAATPRLLNAFASEELMTNWQLALLDATVQGSETTTTTVALTGARLASIRQAGVDTGLANPPDHDELTFTFTQIDVTWVNGGITGTFEP